MPALRILAFIPGEVWVGARIGHLTIKPLPECGQSGVTLCTDTTCSPHLVVKLPTESALSGETGSWGLDEVRGRGEINVWGKGTLER